MQRHRRGSWEERGEDSHPALDLIYGLDQVHVPLRVWFWVKEMTICQVWSPKWSHNVLTCHLSLPEISGSVNLPASFKLAWKGTKCLWSFSPRVCQKERRMVEGFEKFFIIQRLLIQFVIEKNALNFLCYFFFFPVCYLPSVSSKDVGNGKEFRM